MNESEVVKRIMNSKLDGRWKIGRPKNRWMDECMDGVLQDVRNLKIKNWLGIEMTGK